MTNTFDTIVVGAGMAGGWAAKEFTEQGFKTCAGCRIAQPRGDFRYAWGRFEISRRHCQNPRV